MSRDEFLNCDESSIDVESDLGDLDGHCCPVCKWSFRGRKPRMLICGHAFYFCERCLQFKKSIRCSSCGKITEIESPINREFGSLRAELNERRKQSGGQNLQNMEYMEENRRLSNELAHKENEWSQKSVNFSAMCGKQERQLNEASAKNHQLETRLGQCHMQNEDLKVTNEKLELRIVELQSKLELQRSPKITQEAIVHELRSRVKELEANERLLRRQLSETKHQQEESESYRRKLEHEQRSLQVCLENSQSASAAKAQSLRRMCTHMNESIRELRNELLCVRREMPQNVGRYGQWIAVQMSNMVRRYGNTEHRVQQILSAYSREVRQRRKYFNAVQEMKGNIRVYCRIRPLLPAELPIDHEEEGVDPIVLKAADDFCVRINNVHDPKRNKTFEYDRVFGPTSSQEMVFEDTKQLVTSVLDGFNVCIFAYGQTGSGKTYTMQGPEGNRGIYFRAIDELFAVMNGRLEDYQYSLRMSMMEIYNERIRDLLNHAYIDSVDVGLQQKPVYLNLHERRDGTVFADGVTEWNASSVEDVHRALRHGAKNRSVGVTNMNEHSSRSHSILTIEAIGENKRTRVQYLGKLNLIDLAGSERINKSGVRDQQLKEAQSINKSLSALGNVIEALKKKASHVPFRDSKLTFLLQNSLAGQSKTLMFVNVSPTISDVDETICSLNFANRVRNTALGQASRNVRQVGTSPFSSPPSTPFSSSSARFSKQSSRLNSRLRSAPAQGKSVSFVRG